jgi:D-alanyl-D-alanine-carboxypeptidase/D-alanyl-D-alanine-endopeptidase
MKKVLSLAVLAVLFGAPGVVRAQEHVHIPPPPPPPPRPEMKVEAPKPPPKVLTAAETVAAAFATAAGTPARPSASVAYITGGAAPAFASFGRIALPDGAAPSENTVYEIGSITKGLTGIVLADMALAGEVSLHDTLDKFLPEPANFPEAVRKITLLQLATHSSGLPRLPGNLMFGMKDASNPYAHYGAKELQAFLYGYTPPADRTTITPEYSNLGFGVLAYVLSLKAGMPYDALLKARVLDPLGMRDTTIALSDEHRRRLAAGHAKGVAVSNWDFDALGGAGAVRSTAADMAKLLAALMNPPDSRAGKAIKLALEPRGQLGAAKIGFAWLTSTAPNAATFTWHNGGTGGYRSFIGFTQDGKHGIVVLTNGADQSPDPLAVRALQDLARR